MAETTKSVTKTDKRRVAAWIDGDGVCIQEQVPIDWVHAKGNQKWTDDRIGLSFEELAVIAERHLPTAVLRDVLERRYVQKTHRGRLGSFIHGNAPLKKRGT